MSPSIARIRKTGEKVPFGRVANAQPLTHWTGNDMTGMTPSHAVSIMKRAERGYLEDLFDLFAYMLRTDSHVRSTYETPLRTVIGSPLLFDESKVDSGPLAAKVVEFQRESLELLWNYESSAMGIAHAHGIGMAIGEKEWRRVRGANRVVAIHSVNPRNTRFANDWVPEVRIFDGDSGGYDWVRVDEEPLRWMVHIPGSVGLEPHLAGILFPCIIPWNLKKYATGYSQQALERWATPILLGIIGDNAQDGAVNNLRDALENLTASSAGVIEGDTRIEAINSNASQTGDAHLKFISALEVQITKAIMGSALNVDGGTDGGSYAMAKSQHSTTIAPRIQSISDSLAETFREQWFAHELMVNDHLFDGRVMEPAEPYFQIIGEERPQVDQIAIDAGAVTVDEVRASKGLEPWGAEKGGDRIVAPIAKSAPGFARIEAPPEEAPPPFPASRASRRQRQMRLPLSKTSRTSSALMTQIDSVPYGK